MFFQKLSGSVETDSPKNYELQRGTRAPDLCTAPNPAPLSLIKPCLLTLPPPIVPKHTQDVFADNLAPKTTTNLYVA
jgi:hypothetical protein